MAGSGTKDDPWQLTTANGGSQYQMYRDETADPPALVCQVGSTQLRYQLRAIDDLAAWLKAEGDWVPLGGADEQKPAPDGSVEAFGRSAANYAAAGIDGAEIHAAHGYLVAQFLSPESNRRLDAYRGDTPEGRTRFLVEIVEEVRSRCDGDFPVGVRLSAEKFCHHTSELGGPAFYTGWPESDGCVALRLDSPSGAKSP